jgi:3-methylcrotonyl-CoA carboxylase alpha subunit
VRTNAWFLARLLGEPTFAASTTTTGFIGDNQERLIDPPRPSNGLLQYAADDLAFNETHMPGGWNNPHREFVQSRFGFRLNGPQQRCVRIVVDGRKESVVVEDKALWYDHVRTSVSDGRQTAYFEDGACFYIGPERTDGSHAGATSTGAILSPMPGKILAVEVVAGQRVVKGQKLLTLEAMKMEHTLTAPFDGVVAELNAVAGSQVQVEALLARIEDAGEKA